MSPAGDEVKQFVVEKIPTPMAEMEPMEQPINTVTPQPE